MNRANGRVKNGLGDVDTHGLDADIVNVVGLVKHDDAVLGQLARHELGDLWVQQVVVAVDNDVAEGDLIK